MTDERKNTIYFINSDEPVEPSASQRNVKDDYLGYDDYAKALKELAVHCETPVSIGIHGRWGAGKTSLMKRIKFLLDQEKNVRTVWFNPWMFQFEESPLIPLLHEIRNIKFIAGEKVARSGKQLIKKLIGALDLTTVLNASAVLTGIPPVFSSSINVSVPQGDGTAMSPNANWGQNLTFNAKLCDKYFAGKTPMQYFAQNFQDAINAVVGKDGRLVIFIDDLDRCMPERVIKIFETIKLFLNAQRCVFFIAVDRAVVENSIATLYKHANINGADYLEKIIQLPFDIPPILSARMKDYVQKLTNDRDLDSYMPILVEGVIKNPRQVKRFVNTFVLRDILCQKSNMIKYDKRILAKVLVIQFSFPEFYDKMCQEPRILLLLQEYFATPKEESNKWEWKTDSNAVTTFLEKFRDNTRLKNILSMEPKIENTGVLYEYIHATRTFAPGAETDQVNPGMWDFRNSQLTNAVIKSRNMSGYNLSGANLKNADLSYSWFESAKLIGADLKNANLTGVDFSKADLSKVDFRGAKFKNTKFWDAKIEEANFKGVQFDIATLNSLRAASGYKWDEEKFDLEVLDKLYAKHTHQA